MNSCIPSKWTSSRYNLPWFNHSLKRLVTRKQRLYNKAKASGKQNHCKAFRVARKLMHRRLKEDLSNIPDIGYDRIPAIDSLSITTNGVAKQLSLLKTNKASGPDAIPPWFLKEHAAEITPILTNIFQDSIESGTVPSRWKSANVCGVFKKGKKSDPSNYRPISLTCIASKILEHIVYSHVMKHFEHYNILTDCQHSFR